MRILDLFAGIGGFSLAAHWMGWETAAFIEWDGYCKCNLAENFKGVPIYGDVKEFYYEKEKEKLGPIDVICGGFPCQPFSTAGKRNGQKDDRFLWPEMLRVIREVRPTYVVGENVAGLLSVESGTVLRQISTDLEGEGYEVRRFVLPAIALGAPHKRDRIWIVAHSKCSDARRTSRGLQEQNDKEEVQQEQRVDEFSGADSVYGFTADTSEPRTRLQSGDEESSRQRGESSNDSQSQMVRPKNGEINAKGVESCDMGFRNPNKQILERYRGYDQRPGEWFIWKADSQFNPNTPSERRNKREGWAEWLCEDAWQGNRGDQWREHWYEAATRLCGVDDGLPEWLDKSDRRAIYQAVKHFGAEETGRKVGFDCSKVEVFRVKRLKALGNAIVPQIVYEIFKAIEYNETHPLP